MTIGDIVKKYRAEHNMSQDRFSEKSGISKGYISMLENNTNSRSNKPIAPTLEMLQKISIGMGMSVDELLKLVDGKHKVSLIGESPRKNDLRLQKIIDCYDKSDDMGRNMLAEQAEFIQSKHPIVSEKEA